MKRFLLKKIILFIIILLFIINVSTVAFAAEDTTYEPVVTKIKCYYRTLDWQKAEIIDKNEIIYISDIINIGRLTYFKCNTSDGERYLYSGFTKELLYAGSFKCTTYCPCKICNEGWTSTAIGTNLQPWYTIAVDPSVIPLRSLVYIDGLGIFKAEDVGGAIDGYEIDVCVDSHKYAQTQTWYNKKVYIIK